MADLRTADNLRWLDLPTLRRITKSRNLEAMRRRVIQATDDWDLALPESIKIGMWLRSEHPLLISIFYHVIGQESGTWLVEAYRRLPSSDLLVKEEGPPSVLPFGQVTEARVAMKSASGKVVAFNPQEPVEPGFTIWAYREGAVTSLAFDPKEWRWRRQGMIKAGDFFEYSTKQGYWIIVKSQHRQMVFDKWMEDCGYSDQQRKSFFKKLWHPWLPRKISSMIWLTIAEGLPIGAWRVRIGHTGICPLCPGRHMQTAEHGLYLCEAVNPAWEKLRSLLIKAKYNMPLFNWHDILYGNLGRPLARGLDPDPRDPDEDITWDAGTSCTINSGTPWMVIRYALLWYLWCQHCEHDLREGVFHLGVALYKAWQCTVQVGMAA